jgi:23S rRNA pseudouridine955/2504/2580 synthase
MRTFTVEPAWHGKRLDRFLFAHCPGIAAPVIHRAFRKRDVRVNNKRSGAQTLVFEGDAVTAYLPEPDVAGADGGIGAFVPVILYEDDDILVANKPRGVVVQDTRTGKASGEDQPYDALFLTWWRQHRAPLAEGFPALCHRLDRHTGGLLMLAKNEAARVAVGQALKAHHIRKFYRCLVAGTPNPRSAQIDAWLEKDARAGRVYIHEKPHPHAVPIRTRYDTLLSDGDVSLLEVEIVTGRTHQIRAQLARLGHPVLGDSRYGNTRINRQYGVSGQLLWACRLQFDPGLDGALSSARGRTISCGISAEQVPAELATRFAGFPPDTGTPS